MSEKELLAACLSQDRKAQRLLYDRYASKLYAVAIRYTKNREDAQDVLQDAFIKIYTHLGSFRNDCPLEAWLRRIVVNTALKKLRDDPKTKDHADIDLHVDDVADFKTGIDHLQHEYLLALIGDLPSGCQTVFKLFAIEGYQHSEIAEQLGITEGTSKSQYARARQLLKLKIEKMPDRAIA